MFFKLENSCDGAYNSVDIRFTKHCDNACSFCIEKNGLSALGNTDVDKLIESTISTEIKDVLILGGEPFLYPKELFEYIKGIREHVDTIFITTSIPKTFIESDDYHSNIISLIDGLNVSVQSTDWEENNNILNASNRFNRLETLKAMNNLYGTKIRTSLNLVKGGIDNKEKLLASINFLEGIGCLHIKINELQHQKDLYISFEDIMGIKYPSSYAFGCSTYVEIKNVKAKILLKRSCFLVEETRKASIADAIKAIYKRYFYKIKNRFCVIYENGIIYNKWRKK